jgi:hypothetical protein
MVDGARNAFLGFLYQLLGTAAVSVREVASSSDAWAQLIARVDHGQVACEEFGQDATVRLAATPKQGVTAIQFKHSAVDGNLIEPSELIDILGAFDRSRKEADSGGESIEHFVLVTNRRLGPRAQEIADHSTSTTPHRSLTLSTPKKGAPVAANEKRLNPYQGDRARAAEAWHAIIRSLTIFQGETFEGDVDRLRNFTARYGVLDREWVGSLNALVGAFIHESSRGRAVSVSREWLKEHLVGDRDAANLRFECSIAPHISTKCRNELRKQIEVRHRIPPEFYLERAVQQVLHSQLEQFPVVFVAGGGGRGKSLAVANYLMSISDRRLVWSEGAVTASERQIVEAVTLVRLPGRPFCSLDRRLADTSARLEVANGSRRPLWTIDLDGIDEAPERFSQLRELINLCWARGCRDASPASIVATCRSDTGSRTRTDLISQWIDTPEPDLARGVGFVELDEFVGDELVEAAVKLNFAPEQRIIRAMANDSNDAPQHSPTVSGEILQALRHPVIWGGYASLPEADRNGVLDGGQVQLDRLAGQLYDRFLRRCKTRTRWRDQRMLELALPKVARAIVSPPPYSPKDWDQACQRYLGLAEARDLYFESLSYGIIKRDASPSWRWGHLFLVDYLARLDGGDADE